MPFAGPHFGETFRIHSASGTANRLRGLSQVFANRLDEFGTPNWVFQCAKYTLNELVFTD
jgi:hypothetical protein